MSDNGDAASCFNPKLCLCDEEKRRSVEQILKPLHFSAETVQKLREVFEDELELGSALNPRQPPLFSMDNTFIVELPDGTEIGDYLGLDLGNTNFRVVLLKLRHGRQADFVVKYYPIGKQLRIGSGEKVIINPEFSLLCDKNRTDFIMTEFDYALDKESPHPGFVVFEKIVGGLFLGELIRLILLKLVEKKLLFGGQKCSKLADRDSIVASDVSAIEGDTCDSVATMDIIRRLGYESFSTDDVTIVKHVCAIVSIRFAKLLSVCIACLLERMNKPMVTVAMDGSVYKHHPKLHRLLTQFVGEMAPGKKFQLVLAEDGSGKGAALVAAVACRLYKSKKYAQIFKKEHCID